MRIVVASLFPSYFNASGLARAFQKYCNCEVIQMFSILQREETCYKWPYIDNSVNYAGAFSLAAKKVRECDLLVVCGISFIHHLCHIRESEEWKAHDPTDLINEVEKKRKILIVSDSTIFRKEWSDYASRNFDLVFALPSLVHYLKCETRPAFHTNWHYNPPKEINKIVIGHSPGNKAATGRKGTWEIVQVLKEFNRDLKIIYNTSNHDCILAKKDMDIFIEQFPTELKWNDSDGIPYIGSLGKSGQEGMCMGCATITSGNLVDTEPYFPFPPVIIANDKNKLRSELDKLLNDMDYLRQTQVKQYNWSRKYLNPKFVANYILRDFL